MFIKITILVDLKHKEFKSVQNSCCIPGIQVRWIGPTSDWRSVTGWKKWLLGVLLNTGDLFTAGCWLGPSALANFQTYRVPSLWTKFWQIKESLIMASMQHIYLAFRCFLSVSINRFLWLHHQRSSLHINYLALYCILELLQTSPAAPSYWLQDNSRNGLCNIHDSKSYNIHNSIGNVKSLVPSTNNYLPMNICTYNRIQHIQFSTHYYLPN
jgi:hypothetical protein